MSVKLVLGRSGSAYDAGIIPLEVPDMLTLGPFEYVELTYNLLRVGESGAQEGKQIGHFEQGAWWIYDDAHPFTDLNIWADES